MKPEIIENYPNVGVNVGNIVRRIVSHQPLDILEGLREIRVLGRNNAHPALACYLKAEGTIEIYVTDLLGDFPPIFLRLFYPFTYLLIGMAVGHELDHHVNRNTPDIDREQSAEKNIMRYIYPSLGIFKPAARLLSFFGRSLRPFWEKIIERTEAG